MLPFLRFFLIGAIVLAVIYGVLWLVLRERRRDILEDDWETQGKGSPRDTWVNRRLAVFNQRRSRLLPIVVFGLPVCLVLWIIYMTNFR
ncbi:hypothetical protein [Tropicibacter naphthalenivorans]|uniref:Uncharacterized protein n=1 Tax=Tropicibacter naphthalenivorans TaxID=441103 RepID=A0A0N7M036_9RHOB|nr:hypothetical protein [Tropicibacter naphthalenivorans]CUH79369.1 hypothetical protein TRN7648_02436 [Tropicibacter naphthalenivorans]SMC71710.1 hypothetical protein SAMN04488093_10366 [Tropicibacter naphthalenivorans]